MENKEEINWLIRFRDKTEEEICIRKFIIVDPENKEVMRDENGPIAEKDACEAVARAERADYKVVGHIDKPDEKTYICFYLPHKDDKFFFFGKPFVEEFKNDKKDFEAQEDKMFDRRKKRGNCSSEVEILGPILEKYDPDCKKED